MKPRAPKPRICEECNIPLTDANWRPSSQKAKRLMCNRCVNDYHAWYRAKNAEREKATWHRWYEKNRDGYLSRTLRRHKLVRLKALIHYAGNPPKCACCGETKLGLLSFDHINGCRKSARERWKEQWSYENTKRTTSAHRLILEGYPKDIQILCFNCNAGRQWNKGICPHKEITLLDRLYELVKKDPSLIEFDLRKRAPNLPYNFRAMD